MECGICHREHHPQRLPFLCAVDARNSIYEPRISHLQLLVQNESLRRQVDEDLGLSHRHPFDARTKTALDASNARTNLIEDRTSQILAAADALRNEIKAARDEIRAKKSALERRRSELASTSEGLKESRQRRLASLRKSTDELKVKWDGTAGELSESRKFLCLEAASLFGLKQVPAGVGPSLHSRHVEYYLGQVPITDLTDLNAVSPETLSTSLAHISHVLLITCNYLAVRLPAEITLPHRDYPRPTIFNLSGSYRHSAVPFQNTAGLSSASSETKLSNTQHGPRPRPLFIEKPLLQLSKEDPLNYSFFLEGVTLLAYDIAWLCASQGVFVGERGSFSEVSQMGRNLYYLLIHRASPFMNEAIRPSDCNHAGPETPKVSQGIGRFGQYSHGTACDFRGAVPGFDPAAAVKLLSPIKLADQLKKKLGGDTPVGDWDMVDDDIPNGISDPAAVESQDVAAKAGGNSLPKPSGSNGWMKVKNR